MTVILLTILLHMPAISICRLLHNLEYDTLSAIIWFDVHYMKLNEDECHFLLAGITPEFFGAKQGEEIIWGCYEKLLGLTMDKFDKHLSILCKKVSGDGEWSLYWPDYW